ncbi:PIG-L deacetylase family protein [Shewanella nanhaiensis]|uniref:PIG-L family deacetylase n=1 Tax=Shewanella nanhaiensis TaxID=2864872 RepID=A0ABS7E2K6_9GAMM|nr:PIG-L deacetylase family protein [Shewanella nanhaiensis]MBW8183252.1 PIG-L family deacetylase [Shewanella nanhaiensis]
MNKTEAVPSFSVIALFAHPDDETWISGTLATLAARGVQVTPVYVTSGDAGSDHSGQGLTGVELASVREFEARQASAILGLKPPIFLRFPDGKVTEYEQEVKRKLTTLVEQIAPKIVLTFARGGITDNRDHKALNALVSEHFSTLAAYFAVSQSQAEILALSASKFDLNYRIARPVADADISIKLDVVGYQAQRVRAMASHKTQFPPVMLQAYQDYAEASPWEALTSVNESQLIIFKTITD